jgi:hypothetical protein
MLQLWEDGFARHAPDGISIPGRLTSRLFFACFQEEVDAGELLKQSPCVFVRRLAYTS